MTINNTINDKSEVTRIYLALELQGILNWAIKGSLDWQEQGLNPPQVVLASILLRLKRVLSLSSWNRNVTWNLKPSILSQNFSRFMVVI